jgi:hypothetical protein
MRVTHGVLLRLLMVVENFGKEKTMPIMYLKRTCIRFLNTNYKFQTTLMRLCLLSQCITRQVVYQILHEKVVSVKNECCNATNNLNHEVCVVCLSPPVGPTPSCRRDQKTAQNI